MILVVWTLNFGCVDVGILLNVVVWTLDFDWTDVIFWL